MGCSATGRKNPLKPTFIFIIFKNSARTSKRTAHFVTKIAWLKVFKEITAVYSGKHNKPTKTKHRFSY
jgi:hypothetical protein